MKQKKQRFNRTIFRTGLGILMSLFLCLGLFPVQETYADDGKLTIAVDSAAVIVGDTVTVTMRAFDNNGNAATAKMTLTYDSSVFSFEKCSHSNYSSSTGSVTVTGYSVQVTLKAKAEGKGYLKVTASSATVKSTGTSLSALTAAGCYVTVAADASTAAALSADNSLSSLSLEEAELSPTFAYGTTKYTATVDNEVTEVTVNAKTTNSNATITSITGTTDLAVGENTVKITIQAENGNQAVYTITVTRLEETESVATEISETTEDPTDLEVTDPETDVETMDDTEEVSAEVTDTASTEESDQIAQLKEELATYRAGAKRARLFYVIGGCLIFILLLAVLNLSLWVARLKKGETEEYYEEEEENREDFWVEREKSFQAEKKKKAETFPDEKASLLPSKEDHLEEKAKAKEKNDPYEDFSKDSTKLTFIDLEDL